MVSTLLTSVHIGALALAAASVGLFFETRRRLLLFIAGFLCVFVLEDSLLSNALLTNPDFRSLQPVFVIGPRVTVVAAAVLVLLVWVKSCRLTYKELGKGAERNE